MIIRSPTRRRAIARLPLPRSPPTWPKPRPPRVRAALGVAEGDRLLFTVEDGRVSVQSLRDFTRTIQAKYAGMLAGAVDELIAERRAEAERE